MRRGSLVLAAVLLPAAAAAPPTRQAAPMAYVSNERANTVTVIDTSTDRAVRQIRMGPRPRGLEVIGRRLFVALSDDDAQGTGPGAPTSCTCPSAVLSPSS